VSSPFTCDDAHELLPDLALGVLAGDQRAQVLDHLGACTSCEAETSELSATADELLKLTPKVDPPAGFESAVLARLAGPPLQPARWRRSRVLVAAVAAAAVLIGGVTGLLLATRDHEPAIDGRYVDTIQAIGGKDLRAAPLVSGAASWGQAFVFEGKTSWVFVSMSWDVPDGMYHVVLDRSDGPSLTVARLRLFRGQGSAGMTVGDTRTVTAVRVLDPSGHTVCTARMPRPI
jgi:hypothetical protein